MEKQACTFDRPTADYRCVELRQHQHLVALEPDVAALAEVQVALLGMRADIRIGGGRQLHRIGCRGDCERREAESKKDAEWKTRCHFASSGGLLKSSMNRWISPAFQLPGIGLS